MKVYQISFLLLFFSSLSFGQLPFAGRGFKSDTIKSGSFDQLHGTVWLWEANILYIGVPKGENTWEVEEYSAKLDDHTLFLEKFIGAFTEKISERIPLKKTEKFWKNLKSVKFILSPENEGYLLHYGDVTLHLKPYNEIIHPYHTGAAYILRNVLTGKAVGEAHMNIKSIQPFSPAGVAIFESTDGAFGLINIQGQIVAKPEYVEIENNLSGKPFRFVKKISDQPSQNHYQVGENLTTLQFPITVKAGYFKADGTLLLPMTYDLLNTPNEQGIIFAVNEEQLYAYWLSGRELPRIPAARIRVGKYVMIASHGRRDALATFYTVKGALLNDTVYTKIEPFDQESLGLKYLNVTLKGKHGIYNDHGKPIFPAIANEINYSHGFFTVSVSGKEWFVSPNGKNAFNKDFETITPFASIEGSPIIYAGVKSGGKYGTIDTLGNWLVPNQFDEPVGFFKDKEVARKGGKYGVIDASGKIIVPFTYENILFVHDKNFFGFQQNGKWGIADVASGKVITPAKYDQLTPLLHAAFLGNTSFTIKEDCTLEKNDPGTMLFLPPKIARDMEEAPQELTKDYLKVLNVRSQYLQYVDK